MVDKNGGASASSDIKDYLIMQEKTEIVREKLEGHKGSVNSIDIMS